MSEYVTDVDADIARKSIKCIGDIAIRLPNISKSVVHQLRTFLGLKTDHITTETLIILKDVLRKYSDFIEDFIPFLT